MIERSLAIAAAALWIAGALLLPPSDPKSGSGGFLPGTQAVPKFDERLGRGSWSGTRDRGMAMFAELGVRLSRQGLPWDVDEPTPGRSNQADFDDAVNRLVHAGIRIELMATDTPRWAVALASPAVLANYRHAVPMGLYEPVFADGTDGPGNRDSVVNPANRFAAFLAHYVRRYRGKIAYYQIGNEPDYPRGALTAAPGDPDRGFQGSVEDYARLLHVGARVVRAYDPHARVVTGGLGSPTYLAALLDRGAGRDFDLLDFHAYGGPGSDRALETFLAVEQKLRQTLDARGLTGTPLGCSETGYPGDDPAGQRDYAIKAMAMGAALGLRYVCWYDTTNPSWRDMGLVDWRTMTRKTAAYDAFERIASVLDQTRFVGRLPLGPQAIGLAFGRKSRHGIVAWAPYRQTPLPVVLQGFGPAELTSSPLILSR
ncbi:MAG: hypothetical protein KGR26_09585 [Cyanobacteria bacterium REEB65]|nr:hypothetical protein [Cyanobacteria bacterium REEB65]